MAVDRSKYRQELYERTKESYDRKDYGGRFKSVFTPPEGVKLWKVTAGDHIVDIIPFFAGERLGESIIQERLRKGGIAYVLEFVIHRNMGPNKNDGFCPARFFGHRCPACEALDLFWTFETEDKGVQHMIEKLNDAWMWKRRTAYNIWVKDSVSEMEKGVQILEIAHWNLERHICELAQLPKGRGQIIFSDPDEGREVGFKREGTGAENTQYIKHQFYDRESPVPDHILQQAHTLDTCLTYHTYEDLFELMFQVPYEKQPVTIDLILGQSVDEAPKEETPTQEETQERIPEVTTPETEETPKTDEAPKEEAPKEEAPKEEAPKEEEKTEEKKETPKEVAEDECPYGHEFGVDLDKTSDCPECAKKMGKKWDDCADKKDEIQLAEKRAKRKQEREGQQEETEEKPKLRRDK